MNEFRPLWRFWRQVRHFWHEERWCLLTYVAAFAICALIRWALGL